MKYKQAKQYVHILNNGVYMAKKSINNAIPNEEEICYSSKSMKAILEEDGWGLIDENMLKKYKITYSSNVLLANKKKILFNLINEKILTNLNPFKPIRVANS